MAKEPKRVDFAEFARDPGKIFDDMAKRNGPILIEMKGRIYRLELEPKTDFTWATYDADKVRQGLKTSAGTMAGVDREALLRDLRAARQQDSRGRPA